MTMATARGMSSLCARPAQASALASWGTESTTKRSVQTPGGAKLSPPMCRCVAAPRAILLCVARATLRPKGVACLVLIVCACAGPGAAPRLHPHAHRVLAVPGRHGSWSDDSCRRLRLHPTCSSTKSSAATHPACVRTPDRPLRKIALLPTSCGASAAQSTVHRLWCMMVPDGVGSARVCARGARADCFLCLIVFTSVGFVF